MSLQFHKRRETSWLEEWILASQNWLCSLELVCWGGVFTLWTHILNTEPDQLLLAAYLLTLFYPVRLFGMFSVRQPAVYVHCPVLFRKGKYKVGGPVSSNWTIEGLWKRYHLWSVWTYIMIILSSLEAGCWKIFPPLSVVTSLGRHVATLPTPKRKRGERDKGATGDLRDQYPWGGGGMGVRQCDVTSTVSSLGTSFFPAPWQSWNHAGSLPHHPLTWCT